MSKVYDYVKENLIERLEKAIEGKEEFEWIKPWENYSLPMSYKTDKAYTGINAILLPMGGYYVTMKQIKEKGGRLIKGAKSYPVYFWSFIEKEGDSEEEKEKRAIFKYYRVFHQSSIEGMTFKTAEEVDKEVKLVLKAEEVIKAWSREVKINTTKGMNSAYYSPTEDKIYAPDVTQFKNINAYYSVLMHECIHSTGHKDRLNRIKSTKFGSEEYSREELVAELGASLMRTYCDIKDVSVDNNSIAYLQGWLEGIKNGSGRDIAFACQQAQKAFDYIISSI